MVKKIAVGVLAFTLGCNASLSAHRLLVVTDVPKEVGQNVQEVAKQRIKSLFNNKNSGFETTKNTYLTILAMPARHRDDGVTLRDALIKGLTKFMVRQGKQGMQKFFEETISLQADGEIRDPLLTGNLHEVVIYVDLPQRHQNCVHALYESVANICEVFRNPRATWTPFVTLGSFPRLLNPAGLEGYLKNLFPQAGKAGFACDLNSIRVLLELDNGTIKHLGEICVKRVEANHVSLISTWENVTKTFNIPLDDKKEKYPIKGGKRAMHQKNKKSAVKPIKQKVGKPASKENPAVRSHKGNRGNDVAPRNGRRHNGRRPAVSFDGVNRGQKLGALIRMKTMNAGKPAVQKPVAQVQPAPNKQANASAKLDAKKQALFVKAAKIKNFKKNDTPEAQKPFAQVQPVPNKPVNAPVKPGAQKPAHFAKTAKLEHFKKNDARDTKIHKPVTPVAPKPVVQVQPVPNKPANAPIKAGAKKQVHFAKTAKIKHFKKNDEPKDISRVKTETIHIQ